MIDVRGKIMEGLEKQRKKFIQDLNDVQAAKMRAEILAARFKRADDAEGEDLVQATIRFHLSHLEGDELRAREQLRIHELVIGVLITYVYKTDAPSWMTEGTPGMGPDTLRLVGQLEDMGLLRPNSSADGPSAK